MTKIFNEFNACIRLKMHVLFKNKNKNEKERKNQIEKLKSRNSLKINEANAAIVVSAL